MRTTTGIILATLLLATTLPALAAAHVGHASCTSKTLVDTAVLHVDAYNRPCAGATVHTPIAVCFIGQDLHNVVQDVHVLVLYAGGCQTGVVILP